MHHISEHTANKAGRYLSRKIRTKQKDTVCHDLMPKQEVFMIAYQSWYCR